MTPYGQFVYVTRYFNDVAPFYYIGELSLIQADGDTIDLRWDHPLAYSDRSVLFPVYDGNGALQNQLITHAFTVVSGDTLSLYHTGGIQHPLLNSDQSERTFEQDTSLFSYADTVVYLLELIDHFSGHRLDILDSIVYLPAQSYFEYCSNVAESIYNSPYIGFREYLVRRIVGVDVSPGDYKIRLRPLSTTLLSGGVDSLFFAYFEFSSRVTKNRLLT